MSREQSAVYRRAQRQVRSRLTRRLALRRALGWVERAFAPGYGGCYRCWRPWRWAASHMTETAPHGGGVFVLCEPCWRELGGPARVPYYAALFDCWAAQGHPISPDERRQILAAVWDGR